MSYVLSIAEQRPNYYTVMTKCGRFDLNIIGNPDRLLDTPIRFLYKIDVSPKDELRPLDQPVEKLTS